MTELEKKNRELAVCFLRHLAGRSPRDLLHLLTEDCEFHIGSTGTRGIVPWYGVHNSHDQIGAYLDKRGQFLERDGCAFEGPEREPEAQQLRGKADGKGPLHVDKLMVDGDTVVGIGNLTDNFKKDGKGHMYSSDFVLVFKMLDGRIRKFQYFHDTDAVVQAWHKKYSGNPMIHGL